MSGLDLLDTEQDEFDKYYIKILFRGFFGMMDIS